MSEGKSNSGKRLGIGTVLFLIFLVLKLTKVIAWSWWWVCAPIWIPLLVLIPLLILLWVLK